VGIRRLDGECPGSPIELSGGHIHHASTAAAVAGTAAIAAPLSVRTTGIISRSP